MDIQTYRECLAKPIVGSTSVGERLVDDEQLDFVEAQMMKVGSLSHGDVNWLEAEQGAFKLLSEKTKDLKLLTHLLQCLQYQPHPERFTLSLFLLSDFISLYWEECHPAAGARGENIRRKFFNQIIQRTEKSVEKIDGGMFDSEQKAELEQAISELKVAAENKALPVDNIAMFASALSRKIKASEPKSPQPESSNQAKSASSISTSPQPGKIEIDGSSERATKQTLLRLAEFIAELDGGIALATRIRRFAIWFSITSVPDADGNGETQLMPVSVDRIAEYEESLNKGADVELWKKVEQSLTVAPYWIDGHFLSYRIALKLGDTESAESLASEVRQFFKRVPGIEKLKFKGGAPFISEPTLRWIEGSESGSEGGASSSSDWDSKRREALALAENEGLSIALTMLNEGLSSAKEPRDQFYWRMLSADVMQKNQLSAMANQHYNTLLESALHTSLTDWEPKLIQRLESVAKS